LVHIGSGLADTAGPGPQLVEISMFQKVLVANRGEIALRIMRACHELGVASVAVHSTADTDSLHVKFADESVCIGGPASPQSYLNVSRLMAAAEITGADALHPGYGFLSENADFADMVQSANIQWIGPDADTIRRMGDKNLARLAAVAAGVPIVPGSDGLVNADEAAKVAAQIGYPVMLKAVAGGGGKGMRPAADETELRAVFPMASSEAMAAFKNGDMYLEKLLLNPRHVEIQLLADHHGSVLHLGERDCSVQRRHQKLIEESPSPAVNDALRKRMGDAAVGLAKSVGYRSAGTIEFLLDERGDFYFMEMNTRIQVEHPVTEMVTGVDLVKEQIQVASGKRLSHRQEDIRLSGHAIECRINAENPQRGFAPSPGTILSFHPPGGPGVRLDTHLYSGYVVGPHYDSLLAKLICHGANRVEAIARMQRALKEMVIEGVATVIPFHLQVLADPVFREGRVTTSYVAERLADLQEAMAAAEA
jgi:acetyl-CoA carboxylase biotin carboxylase subunit